MRRCGCTREAAGLARELGDSAMVAHCVNNIGNVELSRGEYERALELFQESLAAGRELGNQDLIARASLNLGFTTLLLGDARGARPLLREGLSAARELGQVEGFMYGFAGLGAAYAREDPAPGRAPARPRGRAVRGNGLGPRPARGPCPRRGEGSSAGKPRRGCLCSPSRGGTRTYARGGTDAGLRLGSWSGSAQIWSDQNSASDDVLLRGHSRTLAQATGYALDGIRATV